MGNSFTLLLTATLASVPATQLVAPECSTVGPVPQTVRDDFSLDPFYAKHVDADGLPVVSSGATADEALLRACVLVRNMLSERADVRAKLIDLRARFVVIGKDEGTADIPEYGFRDKPQAEKDAVNARARGLGGQAASCGEENLMCLPGDRYPSESICVHEYSHTVSQAVYELDHSFGDRLQAAFDSARDKGILDGTYRLTSPSEYLAEGAQDWYATNAESDPPDGNHNRVNTRLELAEADPGLYALLGEFLPQDGEWPDCHATQADSN